MSQHLINVQWTTYNSVEQALEEDYHMFYYSPKDNEIYNDMGNCDEDEEFYGIYPSGTDATVSQYELIDLNDTDIINEWKDYIRDEIARQLDPPVLLETQKGLTLSRILNWKKPSFGDFMLVVNIHSYQCNSYYDPEEWDMDVWCDGVLGTEYKLVRQDD